MYCLSVLLLHLISHSPTCCLTAGVFFIGVLVARAQGRMRKKEHVNPLVYEPVCPHPPGLVRIGFAAAATRSMVCLSTRSGSTGSSSQGTDQTLGNVCLVAAYDGACNVSSRECSLLLYCSCMHTIFLPFCSAAQSLHAQPRVLHGLPRPSYAPARVCRYVCGCRGSLGLLAAVCFG